MKKKENVFGILNITLITGEAINTLRIKIHLTKQDYIILQSSV